MTHPPLLPESREGPGTSLAWIVILAVAILLPLLNHLGRQAPDRGGQAGEDLQLRIVARYAIGADALTQMVPGRADARVTLQILPQLQALSPTFDNQFGAVIVVNEIQDTESALARLDAIDLESHPDRAAEVHALRALLAQGPDAIDEQHKALLLERHGWLARVALTHHLPADDPARREARQPAVRTFIAYMIATFGGMALALGGAALLVVGFILWRNGQFVFAYRPLPPPTGAYLEAFAVYVLILLGLSLSLSAILPNLFIVAGIAGGVAFVVGMAWPLLRGCDRREWRYALGLHRGRGVAREVFAGIVGWLAFLPLLILGVVLTYYLSRLGGTGPVGHPIQREIMSGGPALLGAFVLATIWAPVTEELMFRGAFYHHMRARFNAFVSAMLIAVVFALIHPQGLIAVPVLALIAVMLGLVREWRGSMIAPIAAHAMNNGMVLLLMVLLIG